MRRLAACLVTLALLASSGHADDTPEPNRSSAFDDAPAPHNSPAFGALKKELTEAQARHAKQLKDAQQAVRDADTEADKQAAQQQLAAITRDLPGPKFAARFLEFAEQNPDDPMAFAAAMLAFKHSARPATQDNTLGKTLAWLEKHYAARPQIMRLVRAFEASKGPAGEALLREVLAKNPDHRIQGHACRALLAISTRPGEKQHLEKLLKGKYADVSPDLSVGRVIPEIATKDMQGRDVKLSQLRGKVVVLDIWASWCPHCRAMIPQEREMVERLKDQPFALVGVSMDADKEALTELLAKEKLPWRQWWVGENSKLAQDWNIEYFPTIYVIDARGVIRYEGLKGEELEKAVNELLKKMKRK